jgi:hypothetical protein
MQIKRERRRTLPGVETAPFMSCSMFKRMEGEGTGWLMWKNGRGKAGPDFAGIKRCGRLIFQS